jgi:hypothetical protein
MFERRSGSCRVVEKGDRGCLGVDEEQVGEGEEGREACSKIQDKESC